MTDSTTPSRNLRLPAWLGPWELMLAALVVLAFVLASVTNPYFATADNFAITAIGALGLCLMVVPMAWLMVAGEIDLSVASIFGLSAAIFGLTLRAGLPAWFAIILGVLAGAVAGLVNGLLVVDIGLPSLIVTIGTLGLYRGCAYILLGNEGISDLPHALTSFAQDTVPGTLVPYGFLVFLVLAVVAAVLLHRGAIGRKVLAIGSSAEVARFSGLAVRRIKRGLFLFSGTVAGVAGIAYSGYISTVRATNGTGLELVVIGIVLIGGVSMYGGRGSFAGVLLALVLVTILTSWMTLDDAETAVQYMVTGLLMVGAVVIPALAARIRAARGRRTGGRS
ncbi:ABC transporter permease [Amycolatopsis acidiphila]|uniref:Autoinducer 2 import system permease protein LsrD n=1 Tax=Amycolatopsis acidiphila TaxID=715473 RepID=A0A558AJD2_9PSEU|nr:ABC transporter permease [Amycolatopsis acidiphila]TVT24311.1 ABC transporter permease [Amycolatopsis acidiphila]UIJ62556.1 ABC transporter permease [Amycolatopsis acidiphila]GHG85400.1 sugar ABC transporter permease [Amycolatopsis acidiphila]